MKVQLVSDLHCEFQPDLGVDLLNYIEPAADTLVMAGDITKAKPQHIGIVIQNIKNRWKNVLWVSGNHEYYGSSIKQGDEYLNRITQELADNVHYLDNDFIELDRVLFYGGTGWFPLKNITRDQDSPDWLPDMRKYMSDFRVISDIEPEAYYKHYNFELLLQGRNPDIIITHHLPEERCVDPKYKGNPLNQFFVSDFDVENCCAKYWLFGHTHCPVNMQIGETKLVANPHGYPGDRDAKFNPSLVIEV